MRNTTLLTMTVGIATATGVAVASSGWATPTGVFAGAVDGSVSLSGMPNLEGCRYANIVFRPESSDPDKIQRLATAAIVSNKKLYCFSDGCDGNEQRGTSCAMHLDGDVE